MYGYSKSWEIILGHAGDLPGNYYLNISSGSRYGSDLARKMEKLTVSRGQFVAVPVQRRWINLKAYKDKANPGSADYRREVRQKLSTELPGR